MGTIVAASGGGDVGGDGDMIGSFFKVELSRSFTWFRNWSAGWMSGWWLFRDVTDDAGAGRMQMLVRVSLLPQHCSLPKGGRGRVIITQQAGKVVASLTYKVEQPVNSSTLIVYRIHNHNLNHTHSISLQTLDNSHPQHTLSHNVSPSV